VAKKGQLRKRRTAATRAKNRGKNQQPTVAHAKVELSPGGLTVTYDHPNQILPALLEVSSHFASQQIASPAGMASNVLGTARAQVIVSGCANSTSWSCTLGDIGVSLDLFQACVFDHVTGAGFTIELNRIPAQAEIKLSDVVVLSSSHRGLCRVNQASSARRQVLCPGWRVMQA
jgi:hypothetical protein